MPIDESTIIWDDEPTGAAPPAGKSESNRAKSDKIDEGSIQWEDDAQPDADLKGYVDVASSLGSGMAKGLAALPGLPGDIESLGRAGLRKMGYNVDEETYFPRGEEFQQAMKPAIPALSEKPQTRPGKFAETVGEFAVMPMASEVKAGARLAPAAEAAKIGKETLTKAVIPGVASEAAGQATEGTPLEPWARFLAAGAATPRVAGPPKMAETVEAAARAGVDLPSYVAAESRFPKITASTISSLPLTGKMAERAETARTQMGQALESLHEQTGGLNAVQAGQAAKQGILDWIGNKSGKILDDAYDNVATLIDPALEVPTKNLTGMLENLRQERVSAKLPKDTSPAMDIVLNAATSPEGLTFNGLKRLRREIGQMIEGRAVLPEGTNSEELKQLYKALSEDLQNTAEAAGGPKARQAFSVANRMAKVIAERREKLATLVGAKGEIAPERVLGNMLTMATKGKSADINKLVLARRSMAPGEWEAMSSGLLDTMGRDNAGNFTPTRFSTAYNKLTPEGRDVLFGPRGNPTRDALEDLNLISGKSAELDKYANTSKSASHVLGAGTIAALYHNPTLIVPFGATVTAGRIMANPMSAKALAKMQRAFYDLRKNAGAPGPWEARARAAAEAYMKEVNKLEGKTEEPEREQRASGGKVSKRDYPAKKLSRLEKAARRAFNEIANETKPIMDMPDEAVADHLGAMSGERNGSADIYEQ